MDLLDFISSFHWPAEIDESPIIATCWFFVAEIFGIPNPINDWDLSFFRPLAHNNAWRRQYSSFNFYWLKKKKKTSESE